MKGSVEQLRSCVPIVPQNSRGAAGVGCGTFENAIEPKIPIPRKCRSFLWEFYIFSRAMTAARRQRRLHHLHHLHKTRPSSNVDMAGVRVGYGNTGHAPPHPPSHPIPSKCLAPLGTMLEAPTHTAAAVHCPPRHAWQQNERRGHLSLHQGRDPGHPPPRDTQELQKGHAEPEIPSPPPAAQARPMPQKTTATWGSRVPHAEAKPRSRLDVNGCRISRTAPSAMAPKPHQNQ